jgi:phosphatidylglycerophosphatase C
LSNSIAFFDFDGTITTKDTMLEFIKFCKGNASYYKGMIKLSPYLVMLKAGLVSNTVAKEKMLAHFFGQTSLKKFNEDCRQFNIKIVPALIRAGAIKKIKEHFDNKDEVVVVSASAENWIADWCNANGIKYLATQLEIIDEKITGKLSSANCHGEEKVNRIHQAFKLTDYSTIYCYGDTSGDKPILKLATFAFYKPFRS